MNSTTIRKLVPFSVNRQIAVRPSNRSLEGRRYFSARREPKSIFSVRETPDPVNNKRERKLGLGLGLQALSLTLALFALDCDQAKQKEVESKSQHVLDNALSKDRKAAMSVAGECGLGLQYVLDNSLSRDKGAAMSIVQQCGLALQLIDASLQKDKEVVLTAVGQNGLAFQYADPLLRKDGEYVLTLMAIDPRVVWYADESLGENRDFILKAVKIYGLALQYADFLLQNDEEVVLAAVNQNGEAIRFAHLLGNNPDVLFAATRQLGHLIPGKTDIYLRALNIDYFSDSFYHWGDWRDGPDSRLIDKEEVASEVILSRVMLKADGRPLAVVIYPKAGEETFGRYNIIFGSSLPYIRANALKEKGYRTLYYEVRTDIEFYNAIRESGATQKIAVLVIAGHGTPETIDFGGNYSNEVYYLGFDDMGEMQGLKEYLEDGSVIVLSSCSTGAGRNNIAGALGRIFPQSRIYAPNRDSAGFKFRYDNYNRIIGAAHCDFLGRPGGSQASPSCEERFTTVVNR